MENNSSATFLGFVRCNRGERGRIAEQLVRGIVNRELEMVIVKKHIGIIDLSTKPSGTLFSTRQFRVYLVNSTLEVTEGVNLLKNMGTWHKPTFFMMIGDDQLSHLLRDPIAKSYATIEQLVTNMEKATFGIIEPLDDDLCLYSKRPDFFRELVSEAFPDLPFEWSET